MSSQIVNTFGYNFANPVVMQDTGEKFNSWRGYHKTLLISNQAGFFFMIDFIRFLCTGVNSHCHSY